MVGLNQIVSNILNYFKKRIRAPEPLPNPLSFISPTGRAVRVADKYGLGTYGCPRGDNLHEGVDYMCYPGQPVICPIEDATVVREARPYAGRKYSGIEIRNNYMCVRIFYVDPHWELMGQKVVQGREIGKAQDISEKYPRMIPHCHTKLVSCDLEALRKRRG